MVNYLCPPDNPKWSHRETRLLAKKVGSSVRFANIVDCVLQRISTYLTEGKSRPYIVNLDPATHAVPYSVNIGMCARDYGVVKKMVLKATHL